MRVFKCLLALLFGSAIPALLWRQNYQQDFSAKFPAPVQPGKVTVKLQNENGDVITPYVNFEVQGLYTYAGRPQFAARTGGAAANQEVGAVAATYTLGANNTQVAYEIDPLPAVVGNGVYPDFILDDQMITMTEKAVTSLTTAVAWDEAYSGRFDKAVFEFPIRIGPLGGRAMTTRTAWGLPT